MICFYIKFDFKDLSFNLDELFVLLSHQLLLASSAAGYSYLCQPVNYSNDVNEVRVGAPSHFLIAIQCVHLKETFFHNKCSCEAGGGNESRDADLLQVMLSNFCFVFGVVIIEKAERTCQVYGQASASRSFIRLTKMFPKCPLVS